MHLCCQTRCQHTKQCMLSNTSTEKEEEVCCQYITEVQQTSRFRLILNSGITFNETGIHVQVSGYNAERTLLHDCAGHSSSMTAKAHHCVDRRAHFHARPRTFMSTKVSDPSATTAHADRWVAFKVWVVTQNFTGHRAWVDTLSLKGIY